MPGLTRRLLWAPIIIGALAFVPRPAAAQSLVIGGTGSGLGTMTRLAEAFGHLHPELSPTVLPSRGSSGGIKALLAGEIDLAVSARPLKPEERAAGATDLAYGRTPLVLVASRDIKMVALTGEDVVAFFTGARRAWPDGSPVRLILRPESETDSRLLVESFPAIEAPLAALREAGSVPVAYTDQDAANLLDSVPGAFGVLALSVILGEGRALTPLVLDGVAPTPENLADGSYPMGKTLYFVTVPEPSEPTRDFLAFAASPAGRAILEATGHAKPD